MLFKRLYLKIVFKILLLKIRVTEDKGKKNDEAISSK